MTRIFAALKMILTLRCEDSIRILSESRDGQVTWVERWAYRLHLIGCVPCRRFRRQIDFLRQAARLRGSEEPMPPGAAVELSQKTRDQILAKIRSANSEEA